MTGRVDSVAMKLLVWVQISSGLTGRWTEGVKIDMLSSIVPRVIRISQNCPKGVMECNSATAISTSAIPTVMPATTSTHANQAPIPIALPQWQSPMALCFNSKNPSALCMYLSDYESLAEAVQLTLGRHLAMSLHYLTK